MDFDTYVEAGHLDSELDDILAEGSENEPEPEMGPPAPVRMALTAQDVRGLTLFKWQYSLESAGFKPSEAKQMLFLKWLHARHPERTR